MRVVLCCIAKYEDPYIEEWARYYLYGLGVDEIIIFDNSEEFTLKNMTTKFPKKVVRVKHFPGPKRQVEAYTKVLNAFKDQKDTWIAFFDVDEFLVPRNHKTIHENLRDVSASPDVGGVAVRWLLFGDSHLDRPTEEPVTERFTMCDSHLFTHYKCILKAGTFMSMETPHNPVFDKARHQVVDVFGNPVTTPVLSSMDLDDQTSGSMVLHHYFGKTKQEFIQKRSRGRAMGAPLRTEEEFEHHNRNDVHNFQASHVYAKAKALAKS